MNLPFWKIKKALKIGYLAALAIPVLGAELAQKMNSRNDPVPDSLRIGLEGLPDMKTNGPKDTSISDEIELAVGGRDDTKQAWFSIGDLSREFKVTLRTLRFYEDKGLINPRRDGQNRIYGRRDRARLKLVLMGKRVGFSLTEIREMLDLYDLRDGHTAQLQLALRKFNEQISLLDIQKRDIEQAIEELRRTVEIVSGMLRSRSS